MSAYSQSYKEVGVAGMVCKIEAEVKVTVVRKRIVLYLSHIQMYVPKVICRTWTFTLKKMEIIPRY